MLVLNALLGLGTALAPVFAGVALPTVYAGAAVVAAVMAVLAFRVTRVRT